MRISFITKENIDGAQRKVAWFAWQPKGLYYDVGGLLWGCHVSYHVDGNVFRTSPATGGRPRFQGRQVPLTAFDGWQGLGTAMVMRHLLVKNPPLKARDRKPGNVIEEIPILSLDTDSPNIVLELVDDKHRHLLNRPNLQPPPGASQHEARIGSLTVMLTVLGNEEHLLVKPIVNGVRVHHFNDRFTANAKGVTYEYEAYG